MYGHKEIVELLLTYDHLNAKIENSYGKTPIQYASEKGFMEIVERLLPVS